MSRQAATPAATLSAVMLKNIDNQTIDGEAKSKPEVIKLGLDLHARQVTECRQLDGSTPKPAQQWDPCKLLDKVEEWVKAGIKVYSCYEAGACGYWYHRELTKCGAVNYVVAPRALENQRRKHQKTDRLDARALLENLESYLRGNRDAMSIVAVPSAPKRADPRRSRARRVPFGFPAEGALGSGKSRLPSKGNAIIETAIKKIYLTDVAAFIEEVQLQCFKAKTKKPHPQPIQRPSLTV